LLITSPEHTIPLCQGIGLGANRSRRPGYPAGNGVTGTGAAGRAPGRHVGPAAGP